ncbi:VOC family protein, partial [Bacillus sp. OE]
MINLFSKWSLLIYHIICVCGAFLIKLYFKST